MRNQVLDGIVSIINLFDVHQRRQYPSFNLSFTEMGLTMVHEVKECALFRSIGSFYDL
jgi:hypothetical protein